MSMKEHLKRLTTESAYYGISTVGARLLNFLLVPLYTNVLVTADYGVVSTMYAYLAFLNVAFTFGLEPAFMRYYTDCAPDKRKDLFSTPFLSILLVSTLFAVLIHLFATPLASAAMIPLQWKHIIPLGAWTIVIDAINVIPFATLRMQNRPRMFAAIRLLSILMNIGLNLWMILGMGMGVDAIYIAGIVASGFTTLLLLPVTFSMLRPRIQFSTLKPLLIYGIPTIPALLASIIVSTVDKPMMNWLMDASSVGVYQANYKLGIFMMLIVGMFQFAWQPFYLQLKSDPNARQIFSRVMTYFVFAAITITLVFSFFIDDLVSISIFGYNIIRKDYWGGLGIVPVILFSYVWTGIYYISNAGIFIENKTKYLPYISGAGAVVNVVSNYFLIPLYGMFGAAFATLAAYLVMALLSYFITQRFYPIQYEFTRIAKIFASAAIVTVIWYIHAANPIVPEFLCEAGLLLLFGALVWMMRFFSAGEAAEIRSLLRRAVGSRKA